MRHGWGRDGAAIPVSTSVTVGGNVRKTVLTRLRGLVKGSVGCSLRSCRELNFGFCKLSFSFDAEHGRISRA